MSWLFLRNFVPAVLFALAIACRADRTPEGPRVPVLDLIADLDLAEVEREPGVVDLGTLEARALLRHGWAGDESDGGRTFVWSDGPESAIEFFLASPRDLPLSLRGEPYRVAAAPAQEVSLVLNGRPVDRIVVAPGAEASRVVLPGRDLRSGGNRLVLRYAWTRSPWADTAGRSSDRRRLAVAWDLFRFETGVDEAARVRAAGDRLVIPFGWRIGAYLRLPAGAALTLADLRSRGGEPGELRVGLRRDGGEEREVARFQPQGRPAATELNNDGEELVRISLTAVAEKPGGPPGSGLLLRRPLLFASAATEREANQEGAASAVPAALRRPAPTGRPRNVIIYLVDTLRADHLGCYGYARPVSPRIDAFARQATLFRHAVAQSSWTRPAVATILTGLLPRTHDVHGRRDALSQSAVTLAELLKAKGYRTAGFVTNGNVARSFGLAQGFETYQLLPRRRSAAVDVNAAAAEWLESGWTRDAPFFLYLHTVEPHAPYSPPSPFRQRFAAGEASEELSSRRTLRQLQQGKLPPTPELRRGFLDLYDGEIAANDAAFGEWIDFLVRRGLWQDTLIVFLSDHGEEFLEHGGWEHGKTLHTEMLDVPLLVRIPGMGTGAVVERQAQHADVVPTILDALNLPIPSIVEGRSLLPWIAGGGAADESRGEEMAFSWLDQRGFRSASVTTPAWRLIDARSPDPRRALYDRRADPGERDDLAAARPVRAGYLWTWLRAEERPRKGALRAGQGTVDAELRQQLQALGYAH